MKAYQIQEFGLDGLKQVELATPEPGPGEVLVDLKAASLNFRDLMMVKGLYDPNLKLPFTPLSDGAGIVSKLGPGTTGFQVGDRVAGSFFQTWISGAYGWEKARGTLGGPLPGTLAQQIVLKADAAVRIPDALSFEDAATLPCAAVTAWNALFAVNPIQPGDTVLVQGTGGVSIFALQFAKAAGARVVVTSSSDEKLARALELGAWQGINYRDEPNWGKKARELTGGVDCVVEVGGAGTLSQSLEAVGFGGRIQIIGVLSGIAAQIPTTTLLRKAVQMRGIFVGSAEMFQQMNRMIEANGIAPVISHTFDFHEAPDALKLMESAGHFGKVVVRIA